MLLNKEGYWRSKLHPRLPIPKHKGSGWKGRADFLRDYWYAKRKATRKVSNDENHICLCCGQVASNIEYTLGEWQWPDSYEHYIKIHGVRPTDEFIRFIKAASADRSNKRVSIIDL